MPAEATMRDAASILPLTVSNLSYEAGGRRLIDDISCTIPRWRMTALIGPNGAGKSLFLRLCHGLLTPARGSVHWTGGNGTVLRHKRHAMVFQHPVMLRRSVLANMLHAVRSSGLPRSEAVVRAHEALDKFGLADMIHRPARLMSGGEKQRLAIARAWALKPDVIFLDEPTSQLDPGATRQIEAMLQDLMNEGVTLVMATHDLGQARRLATRILFFNRGRIVEQADATTFFPTPATDEARAFLTGDLIW